MLDSALRRRSDRAVEDLACGGERGWHMSPLRAQFVEGVDGGIEHFRQTRPPREEAFLPSENESRASRLLAAY